MLTNRVVKIKNNTQHETNQGLPQGSPMSPFLFIIYTIVLHQINNQNVDLFQYADDLIILISAKTNTEAKQKAEIALMSINNTRKNIKMNLSTQKCHFMRTNPHFDPLFILALGNEILQEVNTMKILGITISNRLILATHYKILKQNAFRNLNILKTIIYRQQGAHPKNGINIYKSTVKSQISFAQVASQMKNK